MAMTSSSKQCPCRTNRTHEGLKRLVLFLLLMLLQVLPWFSSSVEAKSSTRRTVLAIGAANGWVNFTQVESFALQTKDEWTVVEADLPEFGAIMKAEGFQAGLDRFGPLLETAISKIRPDAIMVASKGLNVLTFLINEGIWSGPSILLSPIPNSCNHIAPNNDEESSSWGRQWRDSMKVFVENDVSPVLIGVGSSSDEQSLIVDMMDETKVCGSVVMGSKQQQQQQPSSFSKCPNWKLFSFPGGHGWKNDIKNAPNVALLIDTAFAQSRMKQENNTDEL